MIDDVEKDASRCAVNKMTIQKYDFNIELEIKNVLWMRFQYVYQKNDIAVGFNFGKFAKLNDDIQETYYCENGYVLSKRDGRIVIEKKGEFRHELAMWRVIMKKYSRKALLFRTAVFFLRKLKRKEKEIWLIADRVLSAGDNGESFFRYVSRTNSRNVKPYFVISKNSIDYERIKGIGRVVNYDTVLYPVLLSLADKYISSNADDPTDVVSYHRHLLKDCFRYDHIYLQHGIMKDDHTDSLNHFKKNYVMICAMAREEYKMLLELPYGYTENQVKLTGLARYDDLYDMIKKPDAKKRILFAPTWRKYLSRGEDRMTGKRIFNSPGLSFSSQSVNSA